MKIEYLANASEPPSLLRIFEFTASELELLCAQFRYLSDSPVGASVPLSPLTGIAAHGFTALAASVTSRDTGFVPAMPARWELTAETWLVVHERAAAMRPAGEHEFQWLDRSGSIPVLLSVSGTW